MSIPDQAIGALGNGLAPSSSAAVSELLHVIDTEHAAATPCLDALLEVLRRPVATDVLDTETRIRSTIQSGLAERLAKGGALEGLPISFGGCRFLGDVTWSRVDFASANLLAQARVDGSLRFEDCTFGTDHPVLLEALSPSELMGESQATLLSRATVAGRLEFERCQFNLETRREFTRVSSGTALRHCRTDARLSLASVETEWVTVSDITGDSLLFSGVRPPGGCHVKDTRLAGALEFEAVATDSNITVEGACERVSLRRVRMRGTLLVKNLTTGLLELDDVNTRHTAFRQASVGSARWIRVSTHTLDIDRVAVALDPDSFFAALDVNSREAPTGRFEAGSTVPGQPVATQLGPRWLTADHGEVL